MFTIPRNGTWIKHPTEMKCPKKKIEMSKENRPVTALFSFPGSGNTWTRHLLEYTSGKYSFYLEHLFNELKLE